MIACYIIGGDPRLAREYIRWLNACREGALEAGTFEWSQEEIELKNHKVYGGSHKICIAECMVYVTQNSSAVEVLEDPFIKEILRAVIFSICLHPYNRESVDKKREEKLTFKEKQKVKTTNGAERITGLFGHVLKDLEEAEEAVREIGQEKYKEIFEHYRKPDGKTSTVERETKVEEFGVAIEKPRNITKAQRSGKIHVPVDVGGGILLSYFAKCRKNEDIARQEIAHRKIKL